MRKHQPKGLSELLHGVGTLERKGQMDQPVNVVLDVRWVQHIPDHVLDGMDLTLLVSKRALAIRVLHTPHARGNSIIAIAQG